MKFDNVMVPIDGSTVSDVAVDLAVHSAGTFATHLTFVYVIDVTEFNKFGSIDGGAVEAYKMKTEGKLFLENASRIATNAGIDHETKLIEGIPWQVLCELSREQDMMIMAVTGKSGAGYGRVGSTAEKVIENAFCPVLTLRSGSRKLETILLPVSNKNMAAIDVAIETAKRIQGKVTVFSVKEKESPEALVEAVAAKIREAGVDVDTEIGDGKPDEAIIARSGMYDLVIMGTEGRQGLRKILNGSTAEKVMVSASCPVTIVRDY
jgi:nucleotide-binding universal stress UspA family protein